MKGQREGRERQIGRNPSSLKMTMPESGTNEPKLHTYSWTTANISNERKVIESSLLWDMCSLCSANRFERGRRYGGEKGRMGSPKWGRMETAGVSSNQSRFWRNRDKPIWIRAEESYLEIDLFRADSFVESIL